MAIPGAGLKVPLWILGSSLFGAQVAAALGLPFAFASHFAPAMMMQALEIYRARFQPSEQLARPYVMLGFNVFAAESDDEARLLATSMQQAFVNLRSGRPMQLPPPLPGYEAQLPPAARAMLADVLTCSAVGARDTVRQRAAGLHRAHAARRIDDHLADIRPRGAAAFLRDHRRDSRRLRLAPPARSARYAQKVAHPRQFCFETGAKRGTARCASADVAERTIEPARRRRRRCPSR